MKTSSSEKRLLDLMDRARKAYANHRIVKEETGRWLLGGPTGSGYWFEVVVLAGGRLLFHGDTSPVIFARYHPSETLSPDLLAVETVGWMASRSRPDDRYFLEKAKIGTEAEELIFREDEEALREEISQLIQEEKEAGHLSVAKDLSRVREMVESDNFSEVQREIYDLLGDAERIPRGQVVSSGMVYAHAGLQRLFSLLQQRALRPEGVVEA